MFNVYDFKIEDWGLVYVGDVFCFIFLSIYLYISVSTFIFLSIYLFLFIYLPLSFYLPLYFYLFLFIYLSFCLSAWTSCHNFWTLQDNITSDFVKHKVKFWAIWCKGHFSGSKVKITMVGLGYGVQWDSALPTHLVRSELCIQFNL